MCEQPRRRSVALSDVYNGPIPGPLLVGLIRLPPDWSAALRQFRASPEASDINFNVKYFPYQLYPEASKEGESKYDWYKKSRYGGSEDKMKMVGSVEILNPFRDSHRSPGSGGFETSSKLRVPQYAALMSSYGASCGIDFKFGGVGIMSVGIRETVLTPSILWPTPWMHTV